jgi:hypothetical protein
MYLCKPTTAAYSSRHYGISFSEPSHQLHEWVESFLITSVQHGRAVAFFHLALPSLLGAQVRVPLVFAAVVCFSEMET